MALSVGSSRSSCALSEIDIPGAALLGRNPEELKNNELKFWLSCRGDNAKGLKTKAQLVKRVREYINAGKDKDIVDPDPYKIYTRRKERNAACNSESEEQSTRAEPVKFTKDNWGTSLEKMLLFSKAEMNEHISNSGKRIGDKEHHSVPTNLRKAQRFLDDEYLENIECCSDQRFFFFRAKCCHSYKKNDPPHALKVALCIVSAQVKKAICSCVAGKVGYCNHVLALMFKICKFSLFDCQTTNQLCEEEDQQSSTACTSQLQQWHRKGGGANIAPQPVLEVIINKSKMDGESSKSRPCIKSLLYEARTVPEHSIQQENVLKEELFKLNSNAGLAHMFQDNSNPEGKDTKFGKFQVGCFLSYQVGFTESNFEAISDISVVPRALIPPQEGLVYPRFPLTDLEEMVIPSDLSPNEAGLLNKLDMSESDINELEQQTRDQCKSARWKEERKLRFTASNFHLISKRQRNHDTFAETLLNPKEISSRNLEHGRKYEPIALNAYQKYMFNKKTPVSILKCGLVVSKGFPILGASPDARVIDAVCLYPFGIAEVKCPITKFHVTPIEACTDPNFCMEKSDEDECRLKPSHPYYAQVQGQLGITGAKWCDFIVYTKVGLYVQRITLDIEFWENLREKLQSYYFKNFIKFALPPVVSQSTTD